MTSVVGASSGDSSHKLTTGMRHFGHPPPPLVWTGHHQLSASPPKLFVCHSRAAFGLSPMPRLSGQLASKTGLVSLVGQERLANLISDRIGHRLMPEIEILPWRQTQVVALQVHISPSPPSPDQRGSCLRRVCAGGLQQPPRRCRADRGAAPFLPRPGLRRAALSCTWLGSDQLPSGF